MDRLFSMEVFVASVDLGSFTAAANVFKITPAMVSKHILSLEKRLGATLLARTTRTQKLTEIGQKYYDNCKQILGQIADAEGWRRRDGKQTERPSQGKCLHVVRLLDIGPDRL
jgi:DNA-binding transcriptional LysR family regulator